MLRQFRFIFLVFLLACCIGFFIDKPAISADCVPYAPLYMDSSGNYGAGGAPWNSGKAPSLWKLCDDSSYDFVPNDSCCLKSKIGLRPYELIEVLLKLAAMIIVTIALHLSMGVALIVFIK
jgi:hypothetical protein